MFIFRKIKNFIARIIRKITNKKDDIENEYYYMNEDYEQGQFFLCKMKKYKGKNIMVCRSIVDDGSPKYYGLCLGYGLRIICAYTNTDDISTSVIRYVVIKEKETQEIQSVSLDEEDFVTGVMFWENVE